MSHDLPIRIYYEDTDAGGIVYHARFITFAERGRAEFLRHIGYQSSDLDKELGVTFVIRHIEVDYFAPGFLDDLLTMNTAIEAVKNTSFVMRQKLYRHKNDANELILSDMKVSVVCVDSKTIRPVRIPEELKTKFGKHLIAKEG